MNEMTENGNTAKKGVKKAVIVTVAIVLAAVIIGISIFVALHTSGDYNFTGRDFSENISLYLPKASREELAERYEKKLAENDVGKDYFYPQSGASMDFYITSYIFDGEKYVRYEEFCHDSDSSAVKGYLISEKKENKIFDNCIMYAVLSSSDDVAAARKCRVGEAFGFTADIPEDSEYTDVAGKNMRFVIVPSAYRSPVVSEAEIYPYMYNFFADCKSDKDTAEYGDAVFFSIVAKSGEETIYSSTAAFAFLGDEHLFYGFDGRVVGTSVGSTASFNVTFKNDEFDENDALYGANGKSVDFYIGIYKVCNADKFVAENSDFSDFCALRSHYRFKCFIANELLTEIMDSSEIISYPSGAYRWMRNDVKDSLDKTVAECREYLGGLLGEKVSYETALKYAEKNYFGMEEYIGKKEFIDIITKENLDYLITIYATAAELGIEYGEDDYNRDILKYGDDVKQTESAYIGGKQYWYAYFLSEKITEKLCADVIAAD